MAGDIQPLSDDFPIVDENGNPTIYFVQWAQQRSIDISEATTEEQVTAAVVAYIAAHPIEWGDIDGTLSDQTDLQAALDAKAKLAGGNTFTGAQVFNTAGTLFIDSFLIKPSTIFNAASIAFRQFSGAVTAAIYLNVDHSFELSADTISMWDLNENNEFFHATAAQIDLNTSNVTRVSITDTLVACSVDVTVPDEAYGAGWNGSLEVPTKNAIYDKIESLTPGSSGGVLPVVDGSIPPVFLQNPDGSLIYTPI